MPIYVHQGDLPADLTWQDAVAIDTEAMGLHYQGRDRLCVVQLGDEKGNVHLVQFRRNHYEAPRLKALCLDANITKIFHFGRFDMGIMARYLGVIPEPIYCTKIASRLARTYTDSHGLKELCRELLGVQLSKQQQSSDWGAEQLSKEQLEYAASDVLYLHRLRHVLDGMLWREERMELALKSFAFLPTRVCLDLAGWQDVDIFAH
jgi:ribonuclease D